MLVSLALALLSHAPGFFVAADTPAERPWMLVHLDEDLGCTCTSSFGTTNDDPGQCPSPVPPPIPTICVGFFNASMEKDDGQCHHDLDPEEWICKPLPCEFGLQINAILDPNLCCCDELPTYGGGGTGPWTSPGGVLYTPTPDTTATTPLVMTIQSTSFLVCEPGPGTSGSLFAVFWCNDTQPPTVIASYTVFTNCGGCN